MASIENSQPNKTSQLKPVIKRPSGFSFYWIYGLIFVGIIVFYFSGGDIAPKEISWTKFKNDMLLEHDVEKIDIVNNELVETLRGQLLLSFFKKTLQGQFIF